VAGSELLTRAGRPSWRVGRGDSRWPSGGRCSWLSLPSTRSGCWGVETTRGGPSPASWWRSARCRTSREPCPRPRPAPWRTWHAELVAGFRVEPDRAYLVRADGFASQLRLDRRPAGGGGELPHGRGGAAREAGGHRSDRRPPRRVVG